MCETVGWRIADTRPGARTWDRVYRTYRSAMRAAKRRGAHWTVIERVCTCLVPGADDAEGWNLYRHRHGYAGGGA